MALQPGLSWEDVGRMPVFSFFHVLHLSEKRNAVNMPPKGSKAVRMNEGK